MAMRLVKKFWQMVFCLFCVLGIAVLSPCFASEPYPGVSSHVSVAIGMETLNYSEHEPNTYLDSDADVSNWMLRAEAVMRWKSVFYGLKGSVPITRGDDTEQWRESGAMIQENTLEYGWTRIDGYVGFPLTPFFNPYLGIRWSESDQERTDFVVNGSPVFGAVTETVTAWYFFFGATGHLPLNPQWRLIYSGSYFEPFSSEVTNTNLPGWKVTDEDGYAFEFEGQVEYAVSPTVSVSALLYGGKVHWEGSGWQMISFENFVKWPENDTEYLGGMLNIRWSF